MIRSPKAKLGRSRYPLPDFPVGGTQPHVEVARDLADSSRPCRDDHSYCLLPSGPLAQIAGCALPPEMEAVLHLKRGQLVKRIVPEQPRSRVAFGRPKARCAARVSGWTFAIAMFLTVFRPEWPLPALLLLAGAAASGIMAAAFRVFERPRRFIEPRPSRLWGARVIH